MREKIHPIHTESAPEAVGPYSQAVQFENFIFLSGQIGIDPALKRLVDGGVDGQLEQIFNNIKNVLLASGSDMKKVLKITVFLNNIEDFQRVNEIYARKFTPPYPSRSAVEVSALPLGAEIMLDVIASV